MNSSIKKEMGPATHFVLKEKIIALDDFLSNSI